MSIESKPYFWVTCDWEGCGVSAQEGSDFSAWADLSQAVEDAENGDWLTVVSADKPERHYCCNHTHWSEDEDCMVLGPASQKEGTP